MEEAKKPSNLELLESKLEAMADELAAANAKIEALESRKNSLEVAAPDAAPAAPPTPLTDPGVVKVGNKKYRFTLLAFIHKNRRWTAEEAVADAKCLAELIEQDLGVLEQV